LSFYGHFDEMGLRDGAHLGYYTNASVSEWPDRWQT